MSSWYGGVGPYGTYGNLGLYGALVTYGSPTLTETSPPQSFAEPLTLAQVKSFLKVPERSPTDTAEDDLITSLIVDARACAEVEQARHLVRKQIDLHFDYWPSSFLELGVPLVSVDLVQYRDSDGNHTTLVVDSDFVVDTFKEPGILVPAYNKTWPTFTPWPSSSLLIRFTCGYSADSPFWSGDIGAAVRNGMLFQISQRYNQRLPDGSEEHYAAVIENRLSYGGRRRVR